MKKRRMFFTVVAICLLLSVIAGCGSTNNSSTTNADTNTDSSQSNSTGSGSGNADTTTAVTTPAKDTVVITQNQEPTTYITVDGQFPSSQNKDGIVLYQLYDTLLFLDNDGVPQYNLAKQYEISNDGLEYTFFLRDDVFFHNGDKMTSEDVAFTFNTALELYPSLSRSLLINLDRAEVVDDYTVKLILTEPFAAFINCPTARLGFIVNKKYYEEVGGAEEYNKAPIGTGAYKFESRVSGESVTFIANEEYWGGAPAIKKVIIKPIANVSTQFLSLENNELDLIVNADIGSCLQIMNPNIIWDNTPSSGRTFMMMIARDPSPCADLNLRKAIQSAINKDEIILGALEGYGETLPVETVLTYKDAPDISDVNVVPYDVDQAKQYLADSNYKGETLKLMVVSGGSEERSAQVIQGQLLAIGINVEVMPVDATTRATLARTGEGIDMYMDTSISSLNDISTLNTQYRSSEVKTPNWSLEIGDELDRLMKASDTEMDSAKRKGYAAELLDIITDEVLTIPLTSPVVPVAYNAELKGVQPHFANCYRIKDWTW